MKKRMFRNVCRGIILLSKVSKKIGNAYYTRVGVGTCLCMLPSVTCQQGQGNKFQKVDPPNLTTSYLLKQASVQSVASGTVLLMQATHALIEVSTKYTEALSTLLELMELHIQILGDDYREDKVWDAMLEARADVTQYRLQKQELESVYQCAVAALFAGSTATHLVGAEFTATAAQERLNSTELEIRKVQQKSEELEARLQQLEVVTIDKTAKHALEKESKRLEEEKEGHTVEDTDR